MDLIKTNTATGSAPNTLWEKVLAYTPVVMTVVATLLAGLSTTEMTLAQYDRSLAAQMQSKAGDQWGFFQAKRMRGALQRSTLEILQNTTEIAPFNPETLKISLEEAKPGAVALFGPPEVGQALTALQKGSPPEPAAAPAQPTALKDALDAIEGFKPEPQIRGLLAGVDAGMVENALSAAINRSREYDTATGPIDKFISRVERSFPDQAGLLPVKRAFAAAAMRYNARRYDFEAGLYQATAYLYEVQVRKMNVSAERHHRRSERFFYGMLAAQAAVIISSLAMAARKRSVLWLMAAVAGIAAVLFGCYVYLCV